MVANPDIRLLSVETNKLYYSVSLPNVGVCAPVVVNSVGEIEDSARYYPTLLRTIHRVVLRKREIDYDLTQVRFSQVDWVAGMFMVFPRSVFEKIAGFDTRYFMYLEDTDICRRINRAGYKVLVDSSIRVVHCAQRASRRNLQHLSWHFRSFIRFLFGF